MAQGPVERQVMSERPQSLNTQLANAVASIAAAQDYYQRTKERAAIARNEETDALNTLNKAQENFDNLVAEVKKTAPQGTDWRKPRGQDVERYQPSKFEIG